jgi:hypothetical protein
VVLSSHLAGVKEEGERKSKVFQNKTRKKGERKNEMDEYEFFLKTHSNVGWLLYE